MIVVSTPTGDIGGRLVGRLLETGEPVRVIARDPSRLPADVRARVEVVTGSHGDPDVIGTALECADRLFWLVPPPAFGSPVDARDYYLEFSRPAVRAAADREIPVVGVTSLGYGYRGPAGLLSAAFAMDELFVDGGVAYRALALPFFMENLLRQASAIREQGTIAMANAADRPLAMVATRDAAEMAATLLLGPAWSDAGRVGVVSPDDLTPTAMAEVISEVLGQAVEYREVADLRAGMREHGASAAMADGMAGMVEAQNDGIYAAEPYTAGATGFRQWCAETLRPVPRNRTR